MSSELERLSLKVAELEKKLQQSEKLLNEILDSSPVPQLAIDKNHRIIKWNKALEEYSGIKAKDVIGTDQQWRPFYREKRPVMADLLVDGEVDKIPLWYGGEYAKSKLIDGAYEATDFFPAMGENGKWLYFTASAIKDSSGQTVGAVEILEDVTGRKRVEEEIRESREYLHQIINRISDPIFVKDSEYKYVLVNDALCTFQGRPREKLIGHGSFDGFPEELAAALLKREEEVFRTGIEGLSQDTIPDARGMRVLLAKKSLLVDKKGNRQIVGVLRDITEYKRLEAQFLQAQKMEAVGALAGGVAHDFNNLLNVINGYTEMMLDDLAPDAPLREDLEQVKNAGLRAASLTTQLLAFSRKQILQPEILDLNAVIAGTSSMLRRVIGEDIELISDLQPDLGMVHADPGKIEQVIMNLAVNARDAMPQGGKLILETSNVVFDDGYIRVHSMAKPGPFVRLTISDTGIGMNAKTQERIFEPFFTTKEKGKGTGLGLSTVYGIVKQSDGFIWVYSEPGKGASFKLYFPRVEGQPAAAPEEKSLIEESRGSETVLVIEDEESVRNLACRILQERGYTVLDAANGCAGLDIANKYAGEIHLVFTDVVLPGINGSELVSRLKESRPDIRALYTSGYTDNAIVHNGTLDSQVAFLQKPFTIEGLARKVRDVLNA